MPASLEPADDDDEEFSDLLKQASMLSLEEAKIELLECSRYGEAKAARAILDTFPEKNVIEYKDNHGNSALHKACANGHNDTVCLLISRGSQHFGNESGNTPLHWAVANGHKECVKALLDSPVLSIDVLLKNDFGKSSLSEGFSSQNTEVMQLLLEHDSAEEERIISSNVYANTQAEKKESNITSAKQQKEVTVSDSDINDECIEQVIHKFDLVSFPNEYDDAKNEQQNEVNFSNEKLLLVRELPIKNADNPFGENPSDDTTGLSIWCASLIMARWMSSPSISSRLKGKKILELGAGCAVPSLAAALYSEAKLILISDLNPDTVRNIQHNIHLNKTNLSLDVDIRSLALDWINHSTWPSEKLDYILGSDLIYQASTALILKKIIRHLLKPNGSFFYVAPKDYFRQGLEDFISALKCDGFRCIMAEDAPDKFHQNPLSSRDYDDCFLHFNELSSTKYVLYEFVYSPVLSEESK